MQYLLSLLTCIEAAMQAVPSRDLDHSTSYHLPDGWKWSGGLDKFSSFHALDKVGGQQECKVESGAIDCYAIVSREIRMDVQTTNVPHCFRKWQGCNRFLLTPPINSALPLRAINSAGIDKLIRLKDSPTSYGSCFYNDLTLDNVGDMPKRIHVGTLYLLLELRLVSYTLENRIQFQNKTFLMHVPLTIRSGRCDFIYSFEYK
ncbi:hypothetical protein DSO57_1003229 [Entomophthora muscae]|uniref:Uncharacterized protein n=1 Tax=Entomophthora muscae TaxID=34485 RepID=A0ACC2TWA5_9FUNG|nr:hypothetical protein DSO57_1003229 [Entomophthora muscae]